MAVPLALGVAIFLTELCPQPLRAPISFLTELLAAIPSVVYGLWAVFVLVPLMREVLGPFLLKTLGWTGLFDGPNFGVGLLTASIILAIMILPIISSLTRDIMMAVPNSQREAVLALGATKWEMIRIGVLRNSRIGIVGAIMLGLGRALGETIAVTMVIGNHPEISKSSSPPATPWPASSPMNSPRPPATSTSAPSSRSASPSSSSPSSSTQSPASWSGRSLAAHRQGWPEHEHPALNNQRPPMDFETQSMRLNRPAAL